MRTQVDIVAEHRSKNILDPTSNFGRERPSPALTVSLGMIFFLFLAMLLPTPNDLPCALIGAACFLAGIIFYVGDKRKKSVVPDVAGAAVDWPHPETARRKGHAERRGTDQTEADFRP